MTMHGKNGRQFTVYLKPHKVETDKMIVDWLENDEDPEATVSRKMAMALRYYYENVVQESAVQKNGNHNGVSGLEDLFEDFRLKIAQDTRTILKNNQYSLHEDDAITPEDDASDFSEETAFLANLSFG